MQDNFLKKAFILFMRVNKLNHAIDVNRDTYSDMPNIAGCFKSGEGYIVYKKDEKGQIVQETVFSELEAYCRLASTFGLDFGDWIKSNYSNERGMKGLH